MAPLWEEVNVTRKPPLLKKADFWPFVAKVKDAVAVDENKQPQKRLRVL